MDNDNNSKSIISKARNDEDSIIRDVKKFEKRFKLLGFLSFATMGLFCVIMIFFMLTYYNLPYKWDSILEILNKTFQ